MKIMIIRHGDPDYTIDSLTEKGWREAAYLAEYMANVKAKSCYVSPLGRAKDTASLSLKAMKMEATQCDWLREFSPLINRPDQDVKKITWDWLPQDWTVREHFFNKDHWTDDAILEEGKVKEEYDWVVKNMDTLLAEHGYVRNGYCYDAVKANNDTIVMFCHFGVECVMLSHLLNISPMVLWHGFCAAPTSITTVVTEERRPGVAYFRVSAFGDISHLYVKKEPPSFSARFRECYKNEGERRD